MKRTLGLLAFLTGCLPPPASPVKETHPQVAQPAQSPPAGERAFAEFEFANWPTATKFPIDVSPAVAELCGPGINGAESRWAKLGFEKRHGPHFRHSIVVRVNPDAEAEFKGLAAPLPVGTVVVKEKHADWRDEGPPNEYGAMIKHEPGYDPEHGDWEYLYVVRQPRKVVHGRRESCIDCHSHAKHRDYVFRTYLKADGVADW